MTTPTPIPPTLGRRVADRRERLGWRQKTLADRAGLSVTFISEVENDHRTPGADALLRLAEALDASLDYLMKGEIDVAPARPPLVLPPALAETAEEDGWSVSEASYVLKYEEMVVARRSRGGIVEPGRDLSKDEWRERHRRLFGPDPDAQSRS